MAALESPSKSVVKVYETLLGAWNRRDAEAFASVFTMDGRAIGFDGSWMSGRSEIARALGRVFADHRTAAYVARIRSVTEIAPGVHILGAVAGMTGPDAHTLNPAVTAVQQLVVVTDGGGGCRIALFQNTPAALHGDERGREALTRELSEVLASGRTVDAGTHTR